MKLVATMSGHVSEVVQVCARCVGIANNVDTESETNKMNCFEVNYPT